ncbi:hypothetical protein V2J09_009104 [Rumex salicifolius]
MESSGPSNSTNFSGHLRSNSRTSVGERDHYNNVNLHQSFGNSTYNEMGMGMDRPFHTDISYRTELNPQGQQFMTYSDNQMLTDQYIGGNLGGVNLVNSVPQNLDDESFIIQQQMQQLRERYLALRRLAEHQRLLEMQQNDQLIKLMDEHRPTIKIEMIDLCRNRIDQYMLYQKKRPKDNNIEYWRKFVAEFFNPNAKKRWVHGTVDCVIKNQERVLIKYDSGILEELLYFNLPGGRHHIPSGKLDVIYDQAVQHTIYENFRVVREGRLRVFFTPDLKITSFEFCARRHEEFISRRQVVPQVRQLGYAADRYKASKSSLSDAELRTRRLAKITEAPMVNEYGINKNYFIALMITGTLQNMAPVMHFSQDTGIGPIDSHALLNGRQSSLSSVQSQQQQLEETSSHCNEDDGGGNNTIMSNCL